jgi:arylsulfatase A-like enzyme
MSQLMHVSDWLPTLYSAAGGDTADLGSNLDGVNQWQSLVYNEQSPRHEILVNIDEKYENAALRVDDWKLVLGGYPATSMFRQTNAFTPDKYSTHCIW